jgi:hypothetical protein
MLSLSEAYNKSVQEEMTMTPEQLKTRHVGKQDPKRHLENAVETAMGDQVRAPRPTQFSFCPLAPLSPSPSRARLGGRLLFCTSSYSFHILHPSQSIGRVSSASFREAIQN